MKDKTANITIFMATIILSFLTIEMCLRAYHSEWGYVNFRFPQESKFAGYHVYDAELGWVPKQQRMTAWGETVTILEDGIRSNGRDEVSTGTGDPILAVGDSYTFGDQVSDWQTWPAQLEKFSKRHVINGGVDGYGIDQIFLRARRLLNQHRFSTVIFSFIPDDIRRNEMSAVFATPKPYFDFRGGQLTLENVPVPPPPSSGSNSKLLIPLEHSRFVHAAMKRLLPEWWLKGASERQVQDEETGIKVACALLHELEELTKSRGSELIVLAQHWELEPPSESLTAERVLRCLSDPATRIVNLMPALSRSKAEAPLRYHELFNPFLHMSVQGNEFVAREILPALTER